MTPAQWQQVKQIFHAATQLAGADRSSFLQQGCDGDVELLREVQLLLESHDEAAHFIEQPALVSASEILPRPLDHSRLGQSIGQYRVVREIGRGGMGVVLLAVRDDDQFEKRVAIKILRRGMDTEDLLRRFRNERQILASLEHPHIARLIDGGMTEDGLPYFVLEYVEGEPLDKYCDEHQLPTSIRLQIFSKVCGAVQYAHQNLIVHRDLKPSNILVTSEGEPKLLDFGIAKLLDPELNTYTISPTVTMARLMTPDYASPEQIRGRAITTASDVYSLGVVLYRLLTGHAPYHFADSSPQEIERLVCDSEPERPSTAVSRVEEFTTGKNVARITPESVSKARQEQPEALRRQLRGDVDNIVLKAMRKEPARRYSSAAQLAEDIGRYTAGLPVSARKDTFVYRASKFIGRNRVAAAAAALVLLAILGGLTASLREGRVAARERDQARKAQTKAEQLNKFLQSILSAASPEEKGQDAKVIEVLNDAAQRVDKEFGDQPELKGQALLTIGETYVRIGLVDQAEKALREALKINSGLYGENHRATSSSMIYLSMALINKAKFPEAEILSRQAVAIERKLAPSGSKELALALWALGETHVQRLEFEKAKPLLEESVSISDRLLGPTNEDSGLTLVSLGRAQLGSGNSTEAEATYRQAIEIFRQLPPRYVGRSALVLLNLGALLVSKGNYDEGISVTREADAIYQKQGESYFLFGSKSLLCEIFLAKGEPEKGVEECRRAVDVGRTLKLEEGPVFVTELRYLGLSLTRTGKAREAEPLLRESLDRALKGADAMAVALDKGALGECLTGQNRFADAEPLVVQSYESLMASNGAKHPTTILSIKRVVELYEKWKRPDMAAKYRSMLPGTAGGPPA